MTIEREPPQALPKFYLWPENLAPFQFFLGISSQWRTGVNGATGLDYQVVRSEIALREGRSARRPVAERRERLFSLMCAMEAGALDGWRQRREASELERERQQR